MLTNTVPPVPGEIQDVCSSPLPCGVCKATAHRNYQTIRQGEEEFQLVSCCQCGLVYLDPALYQPIQHNFISDARGDLGKSGKKVEYWSFPELFAKYRAVFESFFAERIDRIRKHLPTANTILDVGVGYGFWMQYAAQRGFSVDGFDVVPECVEYARQEFKLDVQLADLLAYETKKRYDVIMMFDMVEHLENPAEVLARYGDYLAPNGALYIQVPNVLGIKIPWWGKGYSLPHHLWQFDLRTLSQLLDRAGYQVVCSWTGPMGVIRDYERGRFLPIKRALWSVGSLLGLGTRLQVMAKRK
jgi:SAM-dependent methyltransferase